MKRRKMSDAAATLAIDRIIGCVSSVNPPSRNGDIARAIVAEVAAIDAMLEAVAREIAEASR